MALKKEIHDCKEKNTKATQDNQPAKHFSQIWSTLIARRMVGDILKRKADWNVAEAHQSKAKRLRTLKFATVEEVLAMWFPGMQVKKGTCMLDYSTWQPHLSSTKVSHIHLFSLLE